MPRGLVSRGDLLRALLEQGGELPASALRALGYDRKPAAPSAPPTPPRAAAPPPPPRARSRRLNHPPVPSVPLTPASLWQPISLVPDEIRYPGDQPSRAIPAARPARNPGRPSDYRYLASFSQLVPRLRNALSEHRPSRAVDIPRIVSRIGRGEYLRRLPLRIRTGWGSNLYVIEDRSDHLAPYVRDQAMVQLHLQRLYPASTFRAALYSETCSRPEVYWPDGTITQIDPQPGDQVLVLGDLGSLAKDGGRAERFWHAFGEELETLGVAALALLPCAPADCPPTVAAHYRLLSWEHPAPPVLAGEALQRRGQELLARLSIASRIEPRLLREMRLALDAPERFPARLESWAWQHTAVTGTGMLATALTDAEALKQRARLRAQPDPGRVAATLKLARDAMRHLPYEIWLETVLNFADWYPSAITADERHDALALLDHLADRVATPGADPLRPRALEWLEGFYQRLSESVKESPAAKDACWILGRALLDERGQALAPAPREALRLFLAQSGNELHLGQTRGVSPIGEIHSRDRLIQVRAVTDRVSESFWESGQAPSWASDWGWDHYGAWVEFRLEGDDSEPVVQRMRWIDPGTFMMGSPQDEQERWDPEGPRHVVRIQEGFWLFETACTQALWEVVMDENPSRFEGPDRPVERVAWDDVQRFIERLNERVPGLGLSLPSEAQWEYACRAGTDTPFSFGANITPEQVNYDGNHPYPGGEKGEYRQETVPVSTLPANPWGLHEMHGNVWEWVQDAWHDSYEGAPSDGSVWESDADGADRVIRGGSWGDGARDCRSACRNRRQPDYRGDDLGFRPARVQDRELRQGEGSEASGAVAARPAERRRPGSDGADARSGGVHRGASGSGPAGMPDARAMDGAGDGEGRAPVVAAADSVLLRLDTPAPVVVPLPEASALAVRTDREVLTLRRMQRPNWASAMGRDGFGLWAEIAVEPSDGEPVVQRLRWIPPGRFLMGSPTDEPGRFDWEGPRHEVVLGSGYWLFDTPCPQALWGALLGDNPSRFGGDPDRPVERVSWEDVQKRFLPALNERIPGFVLPSEAQWEYACRAGTATALYSGAIEIRGDMDAPALDPIAWYGGNSGVDFDRDDGEDTTSGPWWGDKKKQYSHERAGTRKVKRKQPNPWGLYDMLGNVWEWCEDGWHDDYKEAPTDGGPWRPVDPGAFRVFRGGSWFDFARFCRSAYRFRRRPDRRDDGLGFRCARAQV